MPAFVRPDAVTQWIELLTAQVGFSQGGAVHELTGRQLEVSGFQGDKGQRDITADLVGPGAHGTINLG
ncbi:hypothetical protein DGo_PF0028 (plasmid) [Deinococcus gobiensis I-0]|uniref:Uncharacterized protein n=1 Tax=Deinococcus gobiensis (strain DSM 21396 / JCM 16679 / CGMCC 1.7299 / I-0) TaxID=745776 RepID=H8H404_DEIGI|nr:hypothetical protein DGo_PF0028 [Deinococcus gobiensis I-0]